MFPILIIIPFHYFFLNKYYIVILRKYYSFSSFKKNTKQCIFALYIWKIILILILPRIDYRMYLFILPHSVILFLMFVTFMKIFSFAHSVIFILINNFSFLYIINIRFQTVIKFRIEFSIAWCVFCINYRTIN